MHRCIVLLILLSLAFPAVAFAETKWRKVSPGWKISCGVDKGAITKSRKSYVFKTSNNKCSSRGTYTQRAELSGVYFSANDRISYLFSSTIQMKTNSTEPFTLFQIHDGRGSCAPPLKLHWQRSNGLSFYSSYSLDKGAHDCVENRSLVNSRYLGPKLRRDGTPYQIQIVMDFDGKGAFDVSVFLEGSHVLSGRYEPPADSRFFRSDRFWMKHGVYSKQKWFYEMTSSNIKVMKRRP